MLTASIGKQNYDEHEDIELIIKTIRHRKFYGQTDEQIFTDLKNAWSDHLVWICIKAADIANKE